MGDKVVALKDKAYRVVAVSVPISVLVILGGNAVDNKVTRGIMVKSADDVEQRSLAAARMSEYRNELVLTE